MAAAANLAPDALPAPTVVDPRASPQTDPVALPSAAPSSSFDWHPLVEPEFGDRGPTDVAELLTLLPRADLYVQDEVDIRLHPTLTRCWSRKGHHGQRFVRAPGHSSKVVGFAALDWRDGWLSHGIALGRTADVYCQQLDHLVTRSAERGRIAIVLADNLGIHTPARSTKLRETLALHGDRLHLVYTPAYDPEANPTERFWQPFRHDVTHNHRRDNLYDLQLDARTHFVRLDNDPNAVLRQIGSPFAQSHQDAA